MTTGNRYKCALDWTLHLHLTVSRRTRPWLGDFVSVVWCESTSRYTKRTVYCGRLLICSLSVWHAAPVTGRLLVGHSDRYRTRGSLSAL